MAFWGSRGHAGNTCDFVEPCRGVFHTCMQALKWEIIKKLLLPHCDRVAGWFFHCMQPVALMNPPLRPFSYPPPWSGCPPPPPPVLCFARSGFLRAPLSIRGLQPMRDGRKKPKKIQSNPSFPFQLKPPPRPTNPITAVIGR
nr:hypothetical protein [Morchella crassipes]